MLIVSSFFSGMEIAYLSSDKLRLRLEKKRNSLPDFMNKVFFEQPQEYLTTMLVGNTIAIVIYGVLFALFLSSLSDISSNFYIQLFFEASLSTIVLVLLAEIMPKLIFRIKANFFLKAFSMPAFICYVILYPISKICYLMSQLLSFGRMRHRESLGDKLFDKKDLLYLADKVAYNNNVAGHQKDMQIFQNALDFSETVVKECMVPRSEIQAVALSATNQDLQNIFKLSGYSRILIYETQKDNLIGYVSIKDFFKPDFSIKQMLRKVHFISETVPASQQLTNFIKGKCSIAVVVDEFGGVAGLLTLEDLIEEIFGEIEDEHDSDRLLEKKISNSEYVFAARLEIDYLNNKYALDLPESEMYTTLAGFILYQHNRLPKVNELLTFPLFEILILKTTATRIDLVKLKKMN